MHSNLPYMTATYLRWFLIDFPLRLFTIAWRIVVLVNNKISFTLNLRLLFVPLYGDYTFMGRVIGFVIRIFQVVFGLILVVIISVVSLAAPLLWYIAPIGLIYYYQVFVIPYIVLVYFIRLVLSKEIPPKKVTEVETKNCLKAFRPDAVLWYEKIKKENRVTKEFLEASRIKYLLNKLELNSKEFIEKITSIKLDLAKLDKAAYDFAKEQGTRYVELEHILLGVFSLVPKLDVVLSIFDAKFDQFISTVKWIVVEREIVAKMFVWQEDYELPKMSGIGKGMTGRVTPFLDSVSQDLTKMAQTGKIDEVKGHKKITEEVIDLLSSSNANVLLVGPPGCGKTSIIMGIARKIVKGEITEDTIRYKRIVNIDTSSLLAGTKTAGDISEKIKKLMEELKSSGDIILFFDEIHNFVSGATTEEGSTIFSLLEPHLMSSSIQFIGATNLANYRKYIEPNGSFSRIFHLVEVPPTSKEETMEIIEDFARNIEREKNIVVSYPALEEILVLSSKLIHERVFPDKAIDVLNRTIAEMKNKKYITRDDIRDEISSLTSVPVSSLSEDETQKLLSIEESLKKRVLGQDHALSLIAKALQRARVGIRDEKKPIASFLFVGTTGVGKTETAKALAAEFFGDAKAMIRLDMSEYQQQDSISKLIGEPNGTSKGVLTEAVRTRPFALILLDEIEKAYSSVLLTFLQVLDDGRLTDSSGMTVDFTNTIIIATSNIGTRSIQRVMGAGGSVDEMSDAALKDVREHYAPEFLNRFNGLIVFNPLTKEIVTKITDLMLNRVRKVADAKGVKLSFKSELIEELVSRGYNPEWGARPMARVIEDTVESYLALKLLSKEIKMGDEIELGMEVFNQ